MIVRRLLALVPSLVGFAVLVGLAHLVAYLPEVIR